MTDPAAGSGGIEMLTTQLCTPCLGAVPGDRESRRHLGRAGRQLAAAPGPEVRAAREKNIARRKDAILGTSEFANLQEKPPSPAAMRSRSTSPPYGDAKYKFDALTPHRLGEPFEALRDASDAILARPAAGQKCFSPILARRRASAARATFTKNFFEAGGIEALDNEGYWEIPTLVHHFKKSGTPLVCLCSSDAVYATNATDAAKALKEAGAAPIYLAGRPGDKEAELRAAGIDDFIFAGGDALATLRAAYEKIGT